MKTTLLTLTLLISLFSVNAQDLPNPAANLQTLPAGSFVIAMDNTNQADGSGKFNLKAYGLIVHLLNYHVKVKWVIKAGKAKDGIDFTATADTLSPYYTTVSRKITTTNGSTTATVDNASGLVTGMKVTSTTYGIQFGTTITNISGTTITLSLPAIANIGAKTASFISTNFFIASYNFKSAPFVIFTADTAGVRSLANSYNAQMGLTGTNRIKIYRTTTATANVDIRYDLTNFIPKAAILTDGGNQKIHRDFMIAAGVTNYNYREVAGVTLSDCYTFASEPHNDNTGAAINATVASIKTFVMGGRNFLAECASVRNYENNVNGKFQTTTGISDANENIGSNVSYPYADLSYYQFDGSYNANSGGSLKNWRINAAPANPAAYVKANGTGSFTDVQAATFSKMVSGTGGIVYYLGNHDFSENSQQGINGIRMYMNAFMTPASLAGYCEFTFPLLSVKLSNFLGNLNNNKVNLEWSVQVNETAYQFDVEKSTNGFEFTSAALVMSTDKAGNETYNYAEPMTAEKVYYRLKLTDINKIVTYSKVLVFQTSAQQENTIRIMNNPVNDKLTFSFQSDASQLISVTVIDMSGRQVMQQKISCNKGSNLASFALPATMNRGMYILDLYNGTEHKSAKLIKN